MNPQPDRCQVAVIGSGFAGSLLARILARQGYQVVLLERGRHPRFAIGESSTPLAALSLERLADRYDLPDLRALAAHGRWLEQFPALRRGLKRGFTFYHHTPGQRYRNAPDNPSRLLVAASPNDAIADSHWLREDVDRHFVSQAIATGVDYRDQADVRTVVTGGEGAILRGRRNGAEFVLRAGMVVDASGPAGVIRRQLGIDSALGRLKTRSALLFSHFDDVRLFAEVASAGGAAMPEGPYPDDWAAVHHCFDGGWIYQLRFDHGTVSAGALLSPGAVNDIGADTLNRSPGDAWEQLGRRYPSLGEQMAGAVPRFPIRFQRRVQHRMARATGPGWLALPHTFAFVDPLFSTGIAWSLLGVERLALAFESPEARRTGHPGRSDLSRYEALLQAEADQIDRLIHGAYRALGDFDLFAQHALLYFATVSYAEVRQRLVQADAWAWSGFLGVGDPVLEPVFAGSARRIARLRRTGITAANRRAYADWVRAAIGPRNIAGLAEPARRNLYPVDLDILVERAALLGLEPEQVIAALPRLRGN
jgi:FADH2 O2-dependent halogenase